MEKCDLVLNLSGLHCPYSLMELNGTFKDLRAGALVEIKADRASIVDEIERWCRATGNDLVGMETCGTAPGGTAVSEGGSGEAGDGGAGPAAEIRLLVRKSRA